MSESKNYQYVNLSANFSDFTGDADLECNPGGSYVCPAGVTLKGCPPGSCGGTSVKKIVEGFDIRILIEETEISKLKEELTKVIQKHIKH